MKTFHLPVASVAAIAFAAVSAVPAGAHCGPKVSQLLAARLPLSALPARSPYQLSVPPEAAQGSVQPSAEGAAHAAEPSIAGYWYVRFEANGQLFDDGFDVWSSEGTETLNDTTPPSAGDVCLGVWARTGPFTYTLKHPSWIFDDAGVNLVGVVIIREKVILEPKGNSFSGSATFDVYDFSGNPLYSGATSLTGVRMAALDEPHAPGPIPGLPPSIVKR